MSKEREHLQRFVATVGFACTLVAAASFFLGGKLPTEVEKEFVKTPRNLKKLRGPTGNIKVSEDDAEDAVKDEAAAAEEDVDGEDGGHQDLPKDDEEAAEESGQAAREVEPEAAETPQSAPRDAHSGADETENDEAVKSADEEARAAPSDADQSQCQGAPVRVETDPNAGGEPENDEVGDKDEAVPKQKQEEEDAPAAQGGRGEQEPQVEPDVVQEELTKRLLPKFVALKEAKESRKQSPSKVSATAEDAIAKDLQAFASMVKASNTAELDEIIARKELNLDARIEYHTGLRECAQEFDAELRQAEQQADALDAQTKEVVRYVRDPDEVHPDGVAFIDVVRGTLLALRKTEPEQDEAPTKGQEPSDQGQLPSAEEAVTADAEEPAANPALEEASPAPSTASTPSTSPRGPEHDSSSSSTRAKPETESAPSSNPEASGSKPSAPADSSTSTSKPSTSSSRRRSRRNRKKSGKKSAASAAS